MIRKNKAGLAIRLSSAQTQTQIQTQQITTPDDIGTVRTALTTQTSHNFWCCAPYHARAVTPDEHDLEQRIRPCDAQHNVPHQVATYTVAATYNYSSSTVEQLR
ncbi:hypothetical protein FPSE_01435 [Fusarium pseudograminearum CS3096]|uniref:Uncharacterized protein n=1 Tax=Fusarium pseudograminearum (strain CS3096) TaxID=1028729 RepID=K3W2V9_FUSPC|nr:hypothetical protein FPSE_01435 [Fusarium pseudograminearum CS3096]EKJ78330.1 hypothetical protein FPSE_01435 [Fusarium pseudograminearum CS3096]